MKRVGRTVNPERGDGHIADESNQGRRMPMLSLFHFWNKNTNAPTRNVSFPLFTSSLSHNVALAPDALEALFFEDFL